MKIKCCLAKFISNGYFMVIKNTSVLIEDIFPKFSSK